jgi:two-component system chemotaxis sensor kinase CheA
MDQDMIALESTPGDGELLNRIFRALHTIKGTSGFLGFEPLVRLGHRAEDVLNLLRRGELRLSRRITDLLLTARDQLGQMLSDIRQGGLKTYDLDHLLEELESAQKPEGPSPRLGDILVAEGVIERQVLETVLQEQAASPQGPRLGELLVRKGLASTAEVGNALANQAVGAARGESTAAGKTVRVDSAKLDQLINLIGELVLERNRLNQLTRDLIPGRVAADTLHPAFSLCAARLSFVTEELQTACLKTRMVPIDMVFRKFPRLVRDVAGSLQKEVELQVKGQETEIDKTMVELLGDPLVHLVRNSLDHGLETPNVRESHGKPRKGTIRLEAGQEGDQIVISITDDGAGIDPERVLRKAVEKGLVTAERGQQLTKRDVLDFIFLPGFSTVEKVSDLSGRGVGMDVVRSNLKRMNGSIQLESNVGKGTTVLLQLPLTLAILQVLLVQVSDEIYALPLRSVLETSRIRRDEVHLVEGIEVLRLRGETLPLLRLRKMFATRAAANESAGENVVVLAIGEKRIALTVDRLIGQESTVIKPLGSFLHNCASIAGATVGGDGRVRLVLDPAGLLASAQNPVPQEMVQ